MMRSELSEISRSGINLPLRRGCLSTAIEVEILPRELHDYYDRLL